MEKHPSILKDAYKGRKVFVTGHTGFKGAWLCEWLLMMGAEVTGFSLEEPVSNPSLFEQLNLKERMRDTRGDIRDAEALLNCLLDCDADYIFHLAAQPIVRYSYHYPVQTWETNVLGTIHLLEALRILQKKREEATSGGRDHRPVAVVVVTTDKCYENREWVYGYREEDSLGGYDPYSSSKAATEIAVASWRRSFFCGEHVKIATARAGNVIGGGDWALDRIIPDSIRALQSGQKIPVRNKHATRPWQHVLEPIYGYLLLASLLSSSHGECHKPERDLCSAFNFGPDLDSNLPVFNLVEEILRHWPGEWEDKSDARAPHEASRLHLTTDKACHLLGWRPRWDFPVTIRKTVEWYRNVFHGQNPVSVTRENIQSYCAP